jgi:hypothetical protein
MNQAQIATLKQAAAQANEAYTTEQARLVEAGLKSKARYELLKPLKAAADSTAATWAAAVKGKIRKELNKIIREDAPIRAAAARARSPWKMAKYQAENATHV